MSKAKDKVELEESFNKIQEEVFKTVQEKNKINFELENELVSQKNFGVRFYNLRIRLLVCTILWLPLTVYLLWLIKYAEEEMLILSAALIFIFFTATSIFFIKSIYDYLMNSELEYFMGKARENQYPSIALAKEANQRRIVQYRGRLEELDREREALEKEMDKIEALYNEPTKEH